MRKYFQHEFRPAVTVEGVLKMTQIFVLYHARIVWIMNKDALNRQQKEAAKQLFIQLLFMYRSWYKRIGL